MHADPVAFRTKYRTMAADPFAFFRGTACLFYADVTRIFREGPGVRVLGRDERRRPPGYNVLVEGHSQALDNDVVLSMKQANVPAVSRFVDTTDVDLDWSDLDDPAEMATLVDSLGRATAKVHCAFDEDSDQSLVNLQVEEVVAEVLDGRRREFTADVVEFATSYAGRVRRDHALFVSAFREGEIGGVSAT